MKKKIIAFTIAGALLFGGTGVLAASNLKSWVNPTNKSDKIDQVNYPIVVNGDKLSMKDPATGKDQVVLGYNGRTYVPLRKIAEALGADSDTMWAKDKNGNNYVNIVTPEHSQPTDYYMVNVLNNGAFTKYALASNTAINNAAKAVIAGKTTKEDKAYALYQFVMARVDYDTALINENNNGLDVGAVFAFNTGRGICYDYATLYAAMCDAVGLNVRVVGGVAAGLNGEYLGNHAWNEVQGTNGNWFAVDATWGDRGGDTQGWKFTEKDVEINADTNHDNILDAGRYPTDLIAELENY
jgi:transglutaminase-like putative cysteine protease